MGPHFVISSNPRTDGDVYGCDKDRNIPEEEGDSGDEDEFIDVATSAKRDPNYDSSSLLPLITVGTTIAVYWPDDDTYYVSLAKKSSTSTIGCVHFFD